MTKLCLLLGSLFYMNTLAFCQGNSTEELSAMGKAKAYSDSVLKDSLEKLFCREHHISLARTRDECPISDAAVQALDSERIAYSKHNAAYYDYYRTSFKYRERVFNWQHESTIIIFIMVMLVVLAGLVFSGIHFYRSMQYMQAVNTLLIAHTKKLIKQPNMDSKPASDPEKPGSADHFVKFSKDGIELRSSVLGVIILGLSIAFFYLYLFFVYPINQSTIDSDRDAPSEDIRKP